MTGDKIYKIKDSVDLYLTDGKYLTSYFMNTRKRQTFKINSAMIKLIELIDGKNTLNCICEIMKNKYDIKSETVIRIVEMLYNKKIITEITIDNQIINEEDYQRYARQINYFSEFLGSENEAIKAQKKIFDSYVGIFGCGAVGGNIAIQLVMAGVRKILLFDMDKVEESDVSRHMYYMNTFNGINKVDALKEYLKKIDSNVQIECVCCGMKPSDDIVGYIKDLDFVVNTLDEPYIGYTSSKISRVCIKYNIPHYIAGGFDAHLASTGEIVIPFVTPCVNCYATHFKVALEGWKPRKHALKENSSEIGGLASMNLFSSSFATIEIIKYIAGLTNIDETFKIRGELLFTDLSLTYLDIKKDPNCLICGGKNIL